jgi:hypothetical protein
MGSLLETLWWRTSNSEAEFGYICGASEFIVDGTRSGLEVL